MNAFDRIREEGRLLYEYIRGSHLYGLNSADSDVDTGGVFICRNEALLTAVPSPIDCGVQAYQAQVTDERHDNTWFEIGEFFRLALKSNPSVLESLFVPEDLTIGRIHPIMGLLRKERNHFVSKDLVSTLFNYASSQIAKARGLNKKIVNPVEKRLSPYDFIYTFQGQGSTRFRDWLNNRGMYSAYCGLVNVPNMYEIYGVYYDFGQHRLDHPACLTDDQFVGFVATFLNSDKSMAADFLQNVTPVGYRGILAGDGSSNQLRLSAVWDKKAKPICHISYNRSGYSSHCKDYNQYQEWMANRNEKRYLSNLDKNYDSKNLMHCFRLLHMAKEIALGQGFILKRTEDREFLLGIRNHQFEYDELIERAEGEKKKIERLIVTSPLPDHVDVEWARALLLQVRMEQLKYFAL